MNILHKFKETAVSVLPVMAIVFLLGLTIVPLEPLLLLRFFISGILLIIGLTVFLLGVDLGIQPMGERCGAALTKKKSLLLLLAVAFIIGFIVTAAEPDIQVFGDQVRSVFPFVNKTSFTFVIAGGVGIFIMLGLLRTVTNLSLKWTLFISYTILFVVAFFASDAFIAIGFDSGGATTGPMTVPFIMALGLGVSSVRAGKDDNSFGLTGVSSVGPVLAVLIYAIVVNGAGGPSTGSGTTDCCSGTTDCCCGSLLLHNLGHQDFAVGKVGNYAVAAAFSNIIVWNLVNFWGVVACNKIALYFFICSKVHNPFTDIIFVIFPG
jgi:hypothetical protein